ncbi:AAA family ATPase [Propionivibrio sp.]|uniref:AAA family ATPase n=1 Tax=Propionivibrio sp. TaxID=2212460 RepID=UPI003BF23499
MEAIILCGIQGAGKSTFCRDRYWESHIRLNYDMLRTRHREKLMLAACIESKQSFVVDATNPTILDRERYVSQAKAAKFKVIGIQFVVPVELAVGRNAMRATKQCVPNKAIYATAAKFQPITFAEGFDELWLAIVSADGIELKEKDSAI